ncbi:MAG: DUF5666 domain-containing protein [Chloroflexi bacterium]|nr:DUF5666 domain-containing protein [Chloroflexota bacterium]
MKKFSNLFIPMLVLATVLLSACSGVSAPEGISLANKVQAAPVQFTGVIEAMDGNQWVVDGQAITVDPTVLRDGPFVVGDTVKVEVVVQTDGSLVVTRVEAPEAEDAELSSTPDPSVTPSPVLPGGLAFDNNGTEAFGTVESITVDTVVIDGQTFTIANGAEFKDLIQAGDFVKVHFSLNADGTMSITEIEISDPASVNGDDLGDDNGVDINDLNDDNGDDSNDDSSSEDSSHDQNDDDSSGSENSGSGGG